MISGAIKKCILILKNVKDATEQSAFRGLHFEARKGDKKGIFSIRIYDGYRLGFRITFQYRHSAALVNINIRFAPTTERRGQRNLTPFVFCKTGRSRQGQP